MELTAQDLVYNVLAVCHASIDDLKYSKKKNRKALQTINVNDHNRRVRDYPGNSVGREMMLGHSPGEKFSHILSKACRFDSSVAVGTSLALL